MTRLARLALLVAATLAAPADAAFVLEITPSVPAPVGSIGLVDGHVVATNLGLASITNGSTTVTLGQYLNLQSGPEANFFVLPGLVQAFGGTPPTAHGLGGQSSWTASGGINHLVITGLDAALSPALAVAFGVSPTARYAGTLSLEYVTNSSLAGGQVIRGSIVLAELPGSVPEPASLAMLAIGLLATAGLAGLGGRREFLKGLLAAPFAALGPAKHRNEAGEPWTLDQCKSLIEGLDGRDLGRQARPGRRFPGLDHEMIVDAGDRLMTIGWNGPASGFVFEKFANIA